jgi:copper(I)-binding protein
MQTAPSEKEEPKMKTLISRATMAALFLLAGISLSPAHEVKAGDLLLTQLWARATPAGAKVGAAYLTIENNGSTPDRLVSVSSPVGKAEVHEMKTVDGVMTMRPLESGLAIAPGQKVTLAPGGAHLMITDLKGPLKEGEMVHVLLKFEKAGEIDAGFHIRPVGAQGPGDAALGKPKQMQGPGPEGHSGMKM